MHILLTHAYDRDNKGDAALLSVLINQLRTVYPDADMKVSTMDDIQGYPDFEGVPYSPSFIYLIRFVYKGRLMKGLYTLYILLATALYGVLYGNFKWQANFLLSPGLRRIMDDFIQADLIVPIGGGYIRANGTMAETLNLYLLLHPIYISILLKKPVILYSQSFGPFAHSYERAVSRFVLNRATKIIARERISQDVLHDLGVADNLVARSVDAGFLLKETAKLNLSELIGIPVSHDKIIVGVTVREWLGKTQQGIFEQEMAKFLDTLIERQNTIIVFFAQVTSTLHGDDDRVVNHRIAAMMRHSDNVYLLDQKFDHYQIKALYANLDYLVGTRMHSVIFALTSGVPALCIEYEHKTTGILLDLGLDQWVIKIEAVTADKLIALFDQLVQSRGEYLAKLNECIPRYLDDAQHTIKVVQQAYETAVAKR